jgi:phosphonate transport system substrate-binding protein
VALTFLLPPSLGSAKASARAELIESTLERELGEPVSASVAASYGELEARAAAGTASIVWAPAGVCAKLGAVRAIFTIVRAGRASYRSALVGRREQALTLATLAGARAAWVDALSAGGYLLVAALLREHGVDAVRTFASQRFEGSHRAAVEAVLHGTADVTAVSVASADEATILEALRWYAGPKGDLLGAIALSDACPNDAVVLTTGLGEEDAARIAARLVPATQGARVRSRLLSALEADGLLPAVLDDYRRLRTTLLWEGPTARRSVAPPPPVRASQRPPRR